MAPRYEVEITDPEDVAVVEDQGRKIEVVPSYVFKLEVSNAEVAKRVATNLVKRKYPASAAHDLQVSVRAIYKGPKKG